MQTETDQDPDPETPPSPVVGLSKPRLLSILGPGLVTGASDDDPSGIAIYSQTGAQFGYGLTWTMLFSYPLMSAVQMISPCMGRTTGRGNAGNRACGGTRCGGRAHSGIGSCSSLPTSRVLRGVGRAHDLRHRWVSELIEIADGEDVFREKARSPGA
jgi:Natural resistance-associated macrophage protein